MKQKLREFKGDMDSSTIIVGDFITPPSIMNRTGTSLVVQWLRICLPMQGTRVQALVQEDPTCHKATKPVHHNY